MQAGLQFFDMPIKGSMFNQTQKIAIKMPDQKSGNVEVDSDGFLAVMETLLALSPEQLQTSLKKLEWVPTDEGVELFAPLIDLSGSETSAESMIKLFSDISETTAPYSSLMTDSPSAQIEGSPLSVINIPIERGVRLHANGKGATESQLPMTTLTTNKASFTQHNLSLPEGIRVTPDGANPSSVAVGTDQNSMPAKEINAPNPGHNNTPIVTAEIPATKDSVKAMASVRVQQQDNLKQPLPEGMKTIYETLETEQSQKSMTLSDSDPNRAQTKHLNRAGLSDWHNTSAAVEELVSREIREKPHPKPIVNEKSALRMETEQFKAVSDVLASGSDRGANPIDDRVLKQARVNVQSISSQPDIDKAADESNRVQPNSSAKDTSLSFSSRWGTMLEKSAEMVTDAKSVDAAPDRTEQNDLIRQIVQRMTLKSSRLQSQMNVKLKPEFLGNIRMQITSDNQQVAVRMVADSGVVKEMIEQNLQYLKAELQQHGLEIDKFDVSVGGDSDNLRQEQQAQWRQRSRQKGGAFKENNNDTSDSKDQEPAEQKHAHRKVVNDSAIDYFA